MESFWKGIFTNSGLGLVEGIAPYSSVKDVEHHVLREYEREDDDGKIHTYVDIHFDHVNVCYQGENAPSNQKTYTYRVD